MASARATLGRSAHVPIEIPEDDDPILPEDQHRADIARQVRNYPLCQGHGRPVFAASDSGLSEDDQEDDIVAELREVIDLTEDKPEPRLRHQSSSRSQNVQRSPTKRHQSVQIEGKKIKVNFVYELRNTQGRQFVLGFIQVTEIWEDPWDKSFRVRGIPYTRNRTLRGQLPPKLNEVCMVYEVYQDDPRTLQEQAIIEVPISNLGDPRRLHITNAPYPHHRWDSRAFRSKVEVESSGPLVCRWRVVFQYLGSQHRKKTLLPRAFQILRIRADDVAEPEFRYNDDTLRLDWRGETIRGGSYKAPQGPIPQQTVERAPHQRYTLFDAFCGAGGVSRGAERSGLHVKYAVDVWDKACSSIRMNFPTTQVFETDIFGFITSTADRAMVADVVHLSPPCQFWSPAHTVNGQNDEANIAALFACRTIIEKVRPRVFTLEQTFGIMRARFTDSFNCLISGFTDHDYSVEWKVIECEYYGLPQHRRRLIMMGAGPGETLPPWPAITHSRGGRDGLKPFNTIRKALQPIAQVRNDPHHKPRPCPPSKDSVVSDPDDILRRCMTTSGGQNRHFDNTRTYTNREFACLQGFPIWHQFTKTCARKQIGNAFPPCVVQVFYETIQKHLYYVDGFTGNPRPVLPVIPRDIISLVDEGEDDDDPVEVLSTFRASRATGSSHAASVIQRQVIEIFDENENTGLRPTATTRRKPALQRIELTTPTRSRPQVRPPRIDFLDQSQLGFQTQEERHRGSDRNCNRETSSSSQARQAHNVMGTASLGPYRGRDATLPTRRSIGLHSNMNDKHMFPGARNQIPPPLRYLSNGTGMDAQAATVEWVQRLTNRAANEPNYPPCEMPLQGSLANHIFGAQNQPPASLFGQRQDVVAKSPQPRPVFSGGLRDDNDEMNLDEPNASPRSRTASISGTTRRGALQGEFCSQAFGEDDNDCMILD
ncbi:hypothetical protein ACHAQH_003090 [Verticillium albo-atrum]